MIRKYIESDFERLNEIYNSSKLDELRYEPEKFELLSLDRDEKRRNKIFESDIYLYCDGETKGFIAIYESEIRALFVCPNYRGDGIGQALLRFALENISSDICLFVAHSNTPAIVLYEKYGFKISDSFVTEYNSKQVMACKMVRAYR